MSILGVINEPALIFERLGIDTSDVLEAAGTKWNFLPFRPGLVLGLTFKENCPDVRNTKVADLVRELAAFPCRVDVYDPWVDKVAAEREYGIRPIAAPEPGSYDAIVLAVAHGEFVELGFDNIQALGRPNRVIFDIKSILPKDKVDGRL
jgi:UDP-N-acetyl-D-galactosamine dehydrogenase